MEGRAAAGGGRLSRWLAVALAAVEAEQMRDEAAPSTARSFGDFGDIGGRVNATRVAHPLPAPDDHAPPAGWESLPFGEERAAALAIARRTSGACFTCAGREWWQSGPESRPVCRGCHPPPPVLTGGGGQSLCGGNGAAVCGRSHTAPRNSDRRYGSAARLRSSISRPCTYLPSTWLGNPFRGDSPSAGFTALALCTSTSRTHDGGMLRGCSSKLVWRLQATVGGGATAATALGAHGLKDQVGQPPTRRDACETRSGWRRGGGPG
jgi:hypothetical protein